MLRTHPLTHMTRAPTVVLITPTETIIAWICHLSIKYRHCTAPIPTLHAALHDDLMYVSYEFFLPQPTPLLRIQVFFFFFFFFFFFHLQAALSCLTLILHCSTACTPVFHSSHNPTSSHPPPLSSFQLQNLLPSLHCSPGEPR